ARRTQLATGARDDGSPAGGGTGGAGISRDGSTVVWNGLNAGRQVRVLAGEIVDGNSYYYLWQRLDRPNDTRRITGASDPDDPACDGSFDGSPTALGPCYEPLSQPEAAIGGDRATRPTAPAPRPPRLSPPPPPPPP